MQPDAITIRPRFSINQIVWHEISGDKAMILDIIYYRSSDEIQYIVNYGFGQNSTADEMELSDTQIVI